MHPISWWSFWCPIFLDLPFVCRFYQRKFSWGLSLSLFWKWFLHWNSLIWKCWPNQCHDKFSGGYSLTILEMISIMEFFDVKVLATKSTWRAVNWISSPSTCRAHKDKDISASFSLLLSSTFCINSWNVLGSKSFFWIPKEVLSPPPPLLRAQSATGMKRFLNPGRFPFLKALSHFLFYVVQIFLFTCKQSENKWIARILSWAGALAAEHAHSTDWDPFSMFSSLCFCGAILCLYHCLSGDRKYISLWRVWNRKEFYLSGCSRSRARLFNGLWEKTAISWLDGNSRFWVKEEQNKTGFPNVFV